MAIFPLFFIILAAAGVMAGLAIIYLQIYKRRINRMLAAGVDVGKKRRLPAPHEFMPLAMMVILLCTALVSYIAGYHTAYDRMENAVPAQDFASGETQTFCAEITAISGSEEGGNSVRIKGASQNRAQLRGEFVFAVFGETVIERQGSPLAFSALAVGDMVALTYRGEISSGTPPVIAHVIKIEVLAEGS